MIKHHGDLDGIAKHLNQKLYSADQIVEESDSLLVKVD